MKPGLSGTLRPLDCHAPWPAPKMSVDIAVRQSGKRVFELRQNTRRCSARLSWCQAFVAEPAAVVIHA